MDYVELIVTLLSFIYALAISSILQGIADLLRARSRVRFSLTHAIWMACAIILVFVIWHSVWNLREYLQDNTLPVWVEVREFVRAGILYLICGLIAPQVPPEGEFDMLAYHTRHVRLYASAGAILQIYALGSGFYDLRAQYNLLEFLKLSFPSPLNVLFLLLAAWRRERWVQFVCAIALLLAFIPVFMG